MAGVDFTQMKDLKHIFKFGDWDKNIDIIAINLQEVVDLDFTNVIVSNSTAI